MIRKMRKHSWETSASKASEAADACAYWTIRLLQDLSIIGKFWWLLRGTRSRNPLTRISTTAGLALLAVGRAEQARIMRTMGETNAEPVIQ